MFSSPQTTETLLKESTQSSCHLHPWLEGYPVKKPQVKSALHSPPRVAQGPGASASPGSKHRRGPVPDLLNPNPCFHKALSDSPQCQSQFANSVLSAATGSVNSAFLLVSLDECPSSYLTLDLPLISVTNHLHPPCCSIQGTIFSPETYQQHLSHWLPS